MRITIPSVQLHINVTQGSFCVLNKQDVWGCPGGRLGQASPELLLNLHGCLGFGTRHKNVIKAFNSLWSFVSLSWAFARMEGSPNHLSPNFCRISVFSLPGGWFDQGLPRENEKACRTNRPADEVSFETSRLLFEAGHKQVWLIYAGDDATPAAVQDQPYGLGNLI